MSPKLLLYSIRFMPPKVNLILVEKKKLYGEYRQTKKDMQKIQRAKYDID